MIENKKRYKSKTIWSIIILVLAFLKDQFDLYITESEVEQILVLGTEIFGMVMAIYGRIVAKDNISA